MSVPVSVVARCRSSEMCFFDIETNIFPIELVEFGAIIVDKFSFCELERVHTLVRPASGAISHKATKIHGIDYEKVKHAPMFAGVAQRIFDCLDGRIWVGHNINSFDTPQLTKAFAAEGLQPPTPAATLDTLPLVRRIFGKRAGDCKMATLGAYFGLGVEKHRAVEDSEMTLQAMKCIALHHLLENEMPEIFPKFVDAPKAEKESPSEEKKAAEGASAAAVDQLADQLAGATIASSPDVDKAPKAKKPKKPKKAKAPATEGTANGVIAPAADAKSFIDSSLVSNGTAAPAVATPASAAPAPVIAAAASQPKPEAKRVTEDDGWHEVASKKTLKQAHQAELEAAERAARKKQLKQQVQQKQLQDKPQRERASSAGPPKEAATWTTPPPANTWSTLLKSSPSATPQMSRANSAQVTQPAAKVPTPAPAAVVAAPAAVAKPTAPAATAAPAPVASPVVKPTSSPKLSASAPAFKPSPIVSSMSTPALAAFPSMSLGPAAVPTTTAAAPSTSTGSSWSQPPSASSSSPAVVGSVVDLPTAATASPADRAALVQALDHYVANPTLKCSLAYAGGSNPGGSRIITGVTWETKPKLFKAQIVNNRHGTDPVHFAVGKCISLTLIN